MEYKNRRRRIDTIFVMIIFCVFAVSVLMVLMLGAKIYENVTAMSRDGYADHSILSYIWTKIKNSDDAGRIYIGEFSGLPALFIEEQYGQIQYITTIYEYNGWIYELFCEIGLDFLPEDGVQIAEHGSLTFDMYENGLIKVSSYAKDLLIFPRGNVTGANARDASIGGGPSG
ncbi:MAG: DUF4860 domain-containing protein [Oscillospiraceae bacterium]|nr:DUF4860 domain-containing protein [Oscillospiraceae bacterium]